MSGRPKKPRGGGKRPPGKPSGPRPRGPVQPHHHVEVEQAAALEKFFNDGLDEFMFAGGGGFMLFYCRYDRKHRVADRLTELGAAVTEFAFEPNGLRTWRADDR